MSIQIISDLHLETPKSYDMFDITPKAPYLALLGDIGYAVAHKRDYFAFLKQQLSQFQKVLFIPGNHEAYSSDWPKTLHALKRFERDTQQNDAIGDFILMDRNSFRVPGSNTVILGCSLYSSVPPESEEAVSMGLNDFFQTAEWDVSTHNLWHNRDVVWLNAEVAMLEKENVDIIIFSHWCPSIDPRASDPKHTLSPIGSAFSTDLTSEPCFKSKNVKLWAFGHTHFNCNFAIDRGSDIPPLRLLTNQRGYYFAQAKGFDPEMTIMF